jgi:hypothetical protein
MRARLVVRPKAGTCQRTIVSGLTIVIAPRTEGNQR